MKSLSIFPRTVFVDQNDILQQLRHVRSETDEAMDSFIDCESSFRIAEELVDTIASSVTGLRILSEKYHVDIDLVVSIVNEKNAERGYHS